MSDQSFMRGGSSPLDARSAISCLKARARGLLFPQRGLERAARHDGGLVPVLVGEAPLRLDPGAADILGPVVQVLLPRNSSPALSGRRASNAIGRTAGAPSYEGSARYMRETSSRNRNRDSARATRARS